MHEAGQTTKGLAEKDECKIRYDQHKEHKDLNQNFVYLAGNFRALREIYNCSLA